MLAETWFIANLHVERAWKKLKYGNQLMWIRLGNYRQAMVIIDGAGAVSNQGRFTEMPEMFQNPAPFILRFNQTRITMKRHAKHWGRRSLLEAFIFSFA
jgi:hypothetical protein